MPPHAQRSLVALQLSLKAETLRQPAPDCSRPMSSGPSSPTSRGSPVHPAQPYDEKLSSIPARSLSLPGLEVAGKPYKIFAGSPASQPLATKVADLLKTTLGTIKVGRFSDGEIQIKILENVRSIDVYIVQSTCPPVNEHLMELLLLIRTFKRSSAASVTAIVPYFGYARQDRKVEPRVPISASDVAIFLEAAGVDRVMTVDLHTGQIQGFFHSCPVDNLTANLEIVRYMSEQRESLGLNTSDKICVVSPDAGGVARAKEFMENMFACGFKPTLAITIKQRLQAGVVGDMHVVGNIAGCHCIIVDDICDTAGTLCKSVETLLQMGATKVSACITHPIMSGQALQRVRDSGLTFMIVSDTIPALPDLPDKIHVVSVAKLIAAAVRCITDGTSMSDLFRLKRTHASENL
jgi:ribose-phosphate pyrophosphokinase